MKKSILVLSCFIVAGVFAQNTTTTTTFSKLSNISTDKYGNTVSEQKVTISTKNFKINNFWGKFSNPKSQSIYSNISTTGIFSLSTEASFVCRDGSLDLNGCSGQKPFIVNTGTFTNPNLQKGIDDNTLPQGEYRIPYGSAKSYTPSNISSFYAIDTYRNKKYFTKSVTVTKQASGEGFFNYLLSLIKNYFSLKTTTYNPMNPSLSNLRIRYVENITYGIDQASQAHSGTIFISQPNKATKDKISLLDYNNQSTTQTTGCSGLIFDYNLDSLTCKIIQFFNISSWMPFVNDRDKTVITTTSMVTDTENTLLALAGKLNHTDYLSNISTTSVSGGKGSNFLVQLLKPASYMFKSMIHLFFGSKSTNTTQLADVQFKFKKPVPLAFIIVKNNIVSGIKQMLLTGIESVYGTNVTQCTVKQNNAKQVGYISVEFKTDATKLNQGYRFIHTISTSSYFSQTKTPLSKLNTSYYSVLNPTVTKWGFPFKIFKKYTIKLTTKDWLGWCRRNQGQQSSLLGSLFGNFLQLFAKKSTNPTKNQAIDSLLHNLGFTVVSYQQQVHNNLILDLKNTSSFKIGQPGTTTHFKLLNVMQGIR